MDQLQPDPPLGDHIGGHRTVDAAGQQAHRRAAHADGQAPRAGLGGAVDIGRLLPDLHVDAQLRSVDVHLQMGIGLVEQAPHVLGDLHAGHGEELVRPLGLHLEALRRPQLPVQVRLGAV